MKIAYGYPVTSDDDHFVEIAEESMRVGSLAGAPGKWLVDSLPWRKSSSSALCWIYTYLIWFLLVRFLPDWFPGAGFKRQAKQWCDQLYNQSLEPHDYVKQQLVRILSPRPIL